MEEDRNEIEKETKTSHIHKVSDSEFGVVWCPVHKREHPGPPCEPPSN